MHIIFFTIYIVDFFYEIRKNSFIVNENLTER